MQVFIVYQGSYGDRGAVGVFSTLELAAQHVRTAAEEADSNYVFCDHDIESHVVDAPLAETVRFDGHGKPIR